MKQKTRQQTGISYQFLSACLLAVLAVLFACGQASGFTLHVQNPDGMDVAGFRWMVEEDTTFHVIPGLELTDTVATTIHNSYAPVTANGSSNGSSAVIAVPDDKRYLVTVLPYTGYSISGKNVAAGQTEVTVVVHPQPLPTAQFSCLVFHDNNPLNNAPDLNEDGLGNFQIVISDPAGQQMLDAFGNMLGTTYQRDPVSGEYLLGEDGLPIVDQMGDGILLTDENGEIIVKNLAPGKYGVVIVPPPDDEGWIQTSTIEGTPTVDAWIKANEPPVFVELGPAAYHVFYGFVKQFNEIPAPAGPSGTLTGKVVYNHFDQPPNLQGFWPGEPVSNAWVGLNDPFTRTGLYAAPCDENSEFSIPDVPPGTYELVTWDENLDAIFGFNQVTVPPAGGVIDLGNVLSFAWFGKLEGKVFLDLDEDGFPDPNETGVGRQAVNLRFRNGTIYQFTETNPMGEYAFEEVFPFFKWLVVEVDFARYKATGMTAIVDRGGVIPPDDGWDMPSRNKLNPQPQVDEFGNPIDNPNTDNNLSRTVAGEVLTQAMHLFLGQTNILDWGKTGYGPDENGGISGVVYYAFTRAENDPRYAGAEPWEPGIPNVQVCLYMDSDCDGFIDDLDGDSEPTLADVDNKPFGWRDDPAQFGPEDIDHNENGTFEYGDAIQITLTDSWDDSKPEGAIHENLPVIHGSPVQPGFDNFGTWNQIRDGIFDGGYAFTSYFPGGLADPESVETDGLPNGWYIVEAATPYGYELLKEEDKNVDFGDEWTPSPLLLPPACVGDPHLVRPYLSFQTDEDGVPLPGIDPNDLIEAPYAGQTRPKADRKQVFVSPSKNAAADFFFFTQTPKGAFAIGFINNDLAAEFDPTSPIFGEKSAPSWLPISFQDWTGQEIARVYCDEFGAYNAMLPSSFTNNLGAPSGFSPQMLTFVINHPGPIPDPDNPGQMIIDPYYDPDYSQSPFTFNFNAGTMTYLDTPVFPVAAFVGYPNRPLDVEPESGTPVIYSVEGPDGGPVVCVNGSIVTIQSVGSQLVPNPDYIPDDPNHPELIERDFGFGPDTGTVTVGEAEVPVNSWTNDEIEVVITLDVPTGTVQVIRGDNGKKTDLGVTLHINECSRPILHVSGGALYPATPIQDAIDSADDNALIIIEPGTYWENPIVYKPVTLQGSGAESTILNAMPVPSERVTIWENKVAQLAADGDIPIANFGATQNPGILVYANPGRFTAVTPALIDGLQIFGASAGGGLYIAGNADYTRITNNKIRSNQGTLGGGITVGEGEQGLTTNTGIQILNNHIVKNGGTIGGGGVTILSDAVNYRVKDNLIMGNFTQFSGAGVCHYGLSDGGVIANNRILFNEVFYGGQIGGDGGGIFVSSRVDPEDPGELDNGTGTVTVVNNLIQGNLAGSGFGGGICAKSVNGEDALGPEETWYELRIFNNLIANNVAANAAGGIYLFDVADGFIIHNTVASNDSSATAANTFAAGSLLISNPQPAGIVSAPHSQNLADLTGQMYSNPVLFNTIVWDNHSYHWDASANGGTGAAVPNASDPVWELGVIGFPAVQYLQPQYCLLSSFTDSTGADYDDGTNVTGNPSFVSGHTNTLKTAAVLDEGGNFITVRFEELNLLGDYHLAAGSPAINLGIGSYMADYPYLYQDYEGDWRPLGGQPVDSGADERTVTTCSADLNADCSVNLADLVIFLQFWLEICIEDVPCPGDYSGDGNVNLWDFSEFASQFGNPGCCL